METTIIVLGVAFVPLGVFCFRFQRTTLSISRILRVNVQLALTPSWMGNLGWLCTALGITVGVLLWISRSFWWALGWWACDAIGLAIIDFITPFPSYELCFRIIKASLRRDMAKVDEHGQLQLVDLLKSVESIERDRL